MISKRGLRELAESVGPARYLEIQAKLLGLTKNGTARTDRHGKTVLNESVEFNGKKIPRMHPKDFSLRALFEGLVGPVDEALPHAMDTAGYHEVPQHLQEAVSTGNFPTAVGQLIGTMVIEGYEDTTGFIGDQLVSPMQSTLRDERIVGFTTLQGPKEVIEGDTYEDSTFQDKYVGSRQTKRGRLISITEEAVVHDQTGQVLDRARTIGEMAQQERERRIVRGVINADSGDAIYAPSGTKEALYSSGNNNLLSTATPLADWTDIQEVLTYHATNQTDDRETDDNLAAQPIVWVPKILLTAVENAGTAARIIAATQSRGPSAAEQAISDNVVNFIAPGMTPLSSAFIDTATDGDQWDDSSDWLLGDFKKQFKEKIIWPLQTFRAPAQNPDQFERDIIARFKVRSYGDVIAVDERWVVRVNAV